MNSNKTKDLTTIALMPALTAITGASLSTGVAACVVPFTPTTIVKALMGGILEIRIRKAIN